MHPSFHVSLLRPYTHPNPTFSGRDRTPLLVAVDTDEPDYQIQRILRHRRRLHGGVSFIDFLVRWRGYDAADDSWVPLSSLSPDNACLQAYLQFAAGRGGQLCSHVRAKAVRERPCPGHRPPPPPFPPPPLTSASLRPPLLSPFQSTRVPRRFTRRMIRVVNAYGRSKVAGEQAVRGHWPWHSPPPPPLFLLFPQSTKLPLHGISPGEKRKKKENTLSFFPPPLPLCLPLFPPQVYEGTKSFYKEDDSLLAVNTYGRSKVAGEQAGREQWWGSYAIMRSSIIVGPPPPVPLKKTLPLQVRVNGSLFRSALIIVGPPPPVPPKKTLPLQVRRGARWYGNWEERGKERRGGQDKGDVGEGIVLYAVVMEWMNGALHSALASGQPASFFYDEHRCPVYVHDYPRNVQALMHRHAQGACLSDSEWRLGDSSY
ncbi:unnamed protein product [Closterium sp. NIES-65]|nr:unnamed protein product [Closterium sp. NIES-65]